MNSDRGTPVQLISGRLARVTALWLPALALSIASLTAGTAQAATPRAASFGGAANLASASCRGTSWCMAVGSYTTTDAAKHALAMTRNGTIWRRLKNPPGTGLTSVSCSSRSFCMASGGPTGAERWTGKAWRTMPSPKGGVSGVSCGSRTLCMAVHNQVVRAWDGTRWRVQRPTHICGGGPPGPCGLADVSCGSAANCMAVGTVTVSQEPVQESVALVWNGKTWTGTLPPQDGNPSAANAVSCVRGSCVEAGGAYSETANGGVAVAGVWDASSATWTDVSPNLGTLCPGPLMYCSWTVTLSCASKSSCMAFGGPEGVFYWNGSAWSLAKPASAGPGAGLRDVSCGGSDCVTVGFRTVAGKHRTLAELWNGSAWTIVATPL
jgi:hypothetical protein